MMSWSNTKSFKLLLFVLFIISIFSALPILELRGEEPRRALVSIEMILSGNYTVPTLNGEPYYNKPPLFNWVLVILFKLFNSFDEWIVRFPSALSFILIGIFHFSITKKYISQNVALLSTLFFYTSAHIYFHSSVHTGEIDLFYSLIIYAQAVTLFVFYQKKQFIFMFFISYLLMAAGFLTKGLTSIAFQGITIIAMSIYYKDFKLLFRWQNILGFIGAVSLITIYFLWYGNYNDSTAYIVKLFTESSEKSTIAYGFMPTLLSILEFPFFLIGKTLPWSLLIFLPLFHLKKTRELPGNKFVSFSLLFVIANIAIYWITPGTRIRYLFMFFPFVFTVIAYYAEQYMAKKILRNSPNIIVQILNIILFAALIAAPFLRITKELIAIRYITPLLAILIMLNINFAKKNPQNWVLTLAMVLVIARLGMNLTYWPLSTKTDFRYLEIIEKSKEINKTDKIYLTGEIREFSNTISFGSLDVFKSKSDVVMPPYINYKIPYYLSRDKKYIMEYHPEPQQGKYYIADYDFVKGKERFKKIFTYQYKDNMPEYVLFKIE